MKKQKQIFEIVPTKPKRKISPKPKRKISPKPKENDPWTVPGPKVNPTPKA